MATSPYLTIDRAVGGYRAHFYGANEKLVWWTETYTTKAGAKQAIEFLQYWSNRVPVYDRA